MICRLPVLPAWFRRCFAQLLGAGFVVVAACAGEQTERQIIEHLVAEADLGRPTSELVEAAKERGIGSAVVAAEFLDEGRPARAQALCEVISLTTHCRRLDPRILRVYDLAAYDLFYGSGKGEPRPVKDPVSGLFCGVGGPVDPESFRTQLRMGKALGWKTWPAALPDAAVRAAPGPTVDWLREQSTSHTPDGAKLRALLRSVGWWLRSQSERTAVGDFQEVLVALSTSPILIRDAATNAALLRTLGDAGVVKETIPANPRDAWPQERAKARELKALDFVLSQTFSPKVDVRAAAVEAMGQMIAAQTREGEAEGARVRERQRALPTFLHLAREETEAAVLGKLATASEAWVEEARVGKAMLELFNRVNDAPMQRNILFAVSKTRWPQRGAIMQRGLASSGNGVVGVALEAVAAHPLPEVAPAVFALLEAQKEAQPNLIDAAGALADPRALKTLQRWLASERNLALQLKLVSALENVPGEASAAALADLLGRSAEPLLVEQLCRAASRRELPGAVSTLCALAEDATAPMAIRSQAIWALGRYHESTAREQYRAGQRPRDYAGECLERLRRAPEKYFPQSAQPLLSESQEQARLLILLACWRHGEAAIEPEITPPFEKATPAVQLACLLALTEIRRDHPIVEIALGATDFPVLLGGVRAAGAAAPAKYLPRLRALRASPLIASLSASGLDTWRLPVALEKAIHAGETPASTP